MTITTVDYQNILRTVYQWPTPTRIALIQDLLNTLVVAEHQSSPDASGHPNQHTIQRALGLLDMGTPPPTDTEVEHWLAEHRLHKYGS